MTKREIIGVVAGFSAAVVLIGGYLLWHGHHNKPVKKLSQTVGNHIISLNQPTADTSGGLSVSSGGGASSLGQLDLGQKSSGSSGGASSSGSNGIDPASFAQYDKYKDGNSGLFGEVQAGSGKEVAADSKVAILYKGWLTDGTLFDQLRAGSDGKLQPLVFTVGAHQVILGMEQSIVGMKVGGTRLVIVPPAVGYGDKGQGPVPPNAVLVFEVQLVDVQ
jgi:hypothetical protein